MSSYDPTDIRSQERAKSEIDKHDQLAKETEESDLKWLVSTKRGRRIVWRLLEQAGVFRMSFNTNALQMAFSEGMRNYGNRTLAALQDVSPDSFVMMMKEAKENDRRNNDADNG
jgi:hypothetical protein